MEYLFFVSDELLSSEQPVLITGQEAHHAAVVLRHRVGDNIQVANGKGVHCRGKITAIDKHTIQLQPLECINQERDQQQRILAFGSVRKRDRFEFAIEKAVELGATGIIVFQGDHSERDRMNQKRVEGVILSAFKQSKRFWLPEFAHFDSLKKVFSHYKNARIICADEELDPTIHIPSLVKGENLLLVGPEGGFSSAERLLIHEQNAVQISLGKNRLRTETAVAALLSQYLR